MSCRRKTAKPSMVREPSADETAKTRTVREPSAVENMDPSVVLEPYLVREASVEETAKTCTVRELSAIENMDPSVVLEPCVVREASVDETAKTCTVREPSAIENMDPSVVLEPCVVQEPSADETAKTHTVREPRTVKNMDPSVVLEPCMVREPSADESMDLQTHSDRSSESEESESCGPGEKILRKDNEQEETDEKIDGEQQIGEQQIGEQQIGAQQIGEQQSGEQQIGAQQIGEQQSGEQQISEQIASEEEGGKENQCPDGVKAKEYECKYCSFSTLSLGDFKEHVDASHPGVILNPVYLCVACNFRTRKFEALSEHNDAAHPGETDFKYRKMSEDGKTLLEQTIEDNKDSAESRRFPTAVASAEGSPSGANRRPEQIRALSINGTVIIPEPNLLRDTSHVSPMLQRPPNFSCVPQIAVPLNTSKYNPSLDDNATLMASFNKFPYPTHAELSWLTAASKHPEEQIKVWFTTQRLKQGITWSPEEVEEARKKMFNGSIPPTHNTFTLLPTSPVSKATVHTTTVERNGASANSVSNGLKRILNASLYGPDSKRPVMAVAPNPGDKGLMAPPPLPPPLQKPADAKRANISDIKRTVPSMQPQNLQKNKMAANVPNNSKLAVVPMPSIVFPESLTRPMIAPPPIFAPPFKSTILVPRAPKEKAQISLPNGMLTNSAPLISPQIRRPAVIQTVRGNPNVQGFSALDAAQNEPNGDANNASYNGNAGYNGKWHEASLQNNGHLDDAQSDFQQKAHVLTQFPLLERMKGKSSEQLKVLEENFLRNSFPTHSEVEGLSAATRLSLQEVESWFSERRALRDNLEQALLNSMGTKRNGNVHNGNVHGAEKHNGLKAGGALGFSRDELVSSRWTFADDLSQRWFNGKPGSVLPSSEPIGPRCHDLNNGSNGRAQEVELSWFNKNMSTGQHEPFRFGPPSLDFQSAAVFGRWMDRRQDLSEESSG